MPKSSLKKRDLPEMGEKLGYLLNEKLPRDVFERLHPGVRAPRYKSELAKHFRLNHNNLSPPDMQLSKPLCDRIADAYGFNGGKGHDCKNSFEKCSYLTFIEDFEVLFSEELPPAALQTPLTGRSLRRLPTGVDDHPNESLGAIDIGVAAQLVEGENGCISGVVICRASIIDDMRLAVKFCKVRLTRVCDNADTVLYAGDRGPMQRITNDREFEVELRPVGSGNPPSFELQATKGAIERVDLPQELWKLPLLRDGDRFIAEVLALPRDCTCPDDDDAERDDDETDRANWDDGTSFYRPGYRSLGNRGLEAIRQRYAQLSLPHEDGWIVLHRTRFILRAQE